MRIFLPCSSQRCALGGVGRSGRLLALLVVLGFVLALHTPVHAAEPPSKGGTIVWAVHEGMPDFDIHYQGTYCLHSSRTAGGCQEGRWKKCCALIRHWTAAFAAPSTCLSCSGRRGGQIVVWPP